jgi:hypothetical protein
MSPREGSSTLTTPMSSVLTSICCGDDGGMLPKRISTGPGGCPWTLERGASALTRIPTLQFSLVSCFPFRHSSFGTLHSRQSLSCCQGCGLVSDPIPDPDPILGRFASDSGSGSYFGSGSFFGSGNTRLCLERVARQAGTLFMKL